MRDNDYISGQFLWTGIDFLGECLGWPVRISQAGMLNLAGYEKPLFYQRKALWTDAPFVRIATGRGDSERHGVWNEHFVWAGEEGETIQVSCYTNAAQVELLLNGASLGVKTLGKNDGCRATWEVPYAPGELRAVVDGAEDVLCSTGKAAKLCLTPDVTCLPKDGQAVAQVEVTLLDEQGRVAAAHDERVYYQLTGDGAILGIENGRPDDLTPYSERFRDTLDGRAIVYLRAGSLPGAITLRAYTRGGLEAACTINPA